MIVNFNDNWTFINSEGVLKKVCLPHDAMLYESRNAKCANGVNSGYFPGGKYTYEKEFIINPEDIGKVIMLHFGGVYQNCTVSLNGFEITNHSYGFSPFCADITDKVNCGKNTVTVKIDNSLEPNCRYYTGSGIYRNVYLEIRDKADIENICIETVSYAPATVSVFVKSKLDCIVEIYDDSELIFKGKPGNIELKDAVLWSADSPKLYTCTVKTNADEKTVSFGIRKLSWNAEEGLCVNGERVLLKGGCIHHDNGILGACEYYEAQERRIRILKNAGFNAIRTAHNPASKELLDACDKIGMYVMNEAFDGWYIPKTYHDFSRKFANEWKEELRSMVETSFNHPCVIMYSTGNEVTETASKEGIALCKEMTDFIKTLDTSRPVTCGVNILLDFYTKMGIGVYKDKGEYKPEPVSKIKGYKEKKTGSAFFNSMANKLRGLFFVISKLPLSEKIAESISGSIDILGLNYASSRYEADVKKHQSRLMVGSETMVGDLPYNWDKVKKHPQVLGDFVWSAWDYLGEACIGDWTYHSYSGLPLLAGQGMIDITGKWLAAMYFMQIVWGDRKEPYIGVRPLNHSGETPSTSAWQFTNAIDSWTWYGYEGKKAYIEVFSDSAFVRLRLNGLEIATKKVKEYKSVFRLPYCKGVLTAEALDENKNIISVSHLESGKEETVLSIKPEKNNLHIGEISFISIEFTDLDGILKPYIEQRIDIDVSGSATLIGFGSALCKTDEVFDKPYHNTYRGRCLAAVKAANTTGKAVITVSSDGFETKSINIEVTDK